MTERINSARHWPAEEASGIETISSGFEGCAQNGLLGQQRDDLMTREN
jgi:hypothetical protein